MKEVLKLEANKLIVILGPWDSYLENPGLYELVETVFNKLRSIDYYSHKFAKLFQKGITKVVTSSGATPISVNIQPQVVAIPAIVSTAIPRINVLGSLTQFAWVAVILDAFGPSGHILEAEYTRQASIPTIFVRRLEGETNVPCYVISLYATRLSRLGKLEAATKPGQPLETCKGIILDIKDKGKVKIRGSTGMLKDLTGSIYVTVAFNDSIIDKIKDYLDGKEMDQETLKQISRCFECALELLLEQYEDKLEYL